MRSVRQQTCWLVFQPSIKVRCAPLVSGCFLNCLVAFALCGGCLANVSAEDAVRFNRDIRPILSENCFHCHGPDEQGREADLRLDTQDAAHEWAIVPGKADDSEVIARILSDDPDLKMPPPSSSRSVSSKELETLRKWINDGATYQRHWSFEPIEKPNVPTTRSADRVRNPIDNFVFAQLEQSGLSPQSDADQAVLLRRVSFDLTGLPPTLAELDAFLNDQSEDAFEKAVDRLLSSKRYGERMAADWLDVARYSDTYGYQVDRDRRVWPWRDWVVSAFNRNLPYDEFVTQQLAGDLLPYATRDQVLATTFNRLHPQKVEGGSVPEEFRIEYVADRTQTVGTAFLGLTMECCRCHDHKYDPLSQRDYYRLSAFFDNVDEAGLYSYFTPSVPTPTLDLPTMKQEPEIASAFDNVRVAEEAAAAELDQVALADWLAGGPQAEVRGLVKTLTFDEKDLKLGQNSLVDGIYGKAVKLTGDDGVDVGVGNFKRSEPFSVSLWLNTPDVKERAVVFHRSRAWTDAASRGYQLLIEDGRLSWSLIHFWPGNAIRIKSVGQIETDAWLQVTVTSDGSSRAEGLAIYVDGSRVETEIVRDNLTRAIQGGGGDSITIGQRFRDRGFKAGLVDDLSVFDRELTPIEAAQLFDGKSLGNALAAGVMTDDLVAYFESISGKQQELAKLQAARLAYCELLESVEQIMVMREAEEPRQTHLLNRGMYDQRAESVDPATPEIFAGVAASPSANRRDLARWMTDDTNPLTARVAVNRLWQICFGSGLVTTPEDFGSQGAAPTHPELLDWLASDFRENGWDIKRSLKLIVTSTTYRQSSNAPVELIERDPRNALLARGPSERLSAEMLRDNALFVSGLLVKELGGAPAKPYEVEASFKPVKRDKGEGLYRRSLYTYWKRTSPAPAMMTLDAAKRDVCQVKREKTATPLQAFVLLNGPQYQEAARVTAERLVAEFSENPIAALPLLFRQLTSRHPTASQKDVLETLFKNQLELFRSDPEAATEYLTIGDQPRDESLPSVDVAAMASVTAMLMNYDGCVTKR